MVVADDGEAMPEEVLSQALTPYFAPKAAGTPSPDGDRGVFHIVNAAATAPTS
jgi:hypothetical protein